MIDKMNKVEGEVVDPVAKVEGERKVIKMTPLGLILGNIK